MRPVSREQFGKLRQRMQRHVAFFKRLVDRIEFNGGMPGEKIYDEAWAAKNATASLYVTVHYRSCTHVGGADIDRPGDPALWCGDGI